MTFCLNTTIVKPEEGEEIKNAVILLHGYGGDGKDISMLTLNWKRFLKMISLTLSLLLIRKMRFIFFRLDQLQK